MCGISDAGYSLKKCDYLIQYYRYIDLIKEIITFTFADIQRISSSSGKDIENIE